MEKLKKTKNLLAFSGGTDSSALFFKLLEKNIPFDIATVNYHTRPTSSQEVEYAKKLGKEYNKKVFVKECFLEKFSEKKARECRYEFFEEIIKKEGYDTLITAHQLNDRFEWFLMQFGKGAGLKELISMQKEEKRGFYTIYRPLCFTTRDEILEYLHSKKIKYFVDESNYETKFKRNFIRHKFSDEFIKLYKEGVKRSFRYLEEDLELLFDKEWKKIKDLYFFKKSTPKKDIKKVDLILKELKTLLTKSQRDEIVKTGFNCVIQSKTAVASSKDYIFISPYVKIPLKKEQKELFRRLKIPPKVRSYIAKEKLCHMLSTEIFTDV